MMKKSILIYLLLSYINNCSSTLVDGIVTLSWTVSGSSPVVDRFLTNQTSIQLKLFCSEQTSISISNNKSGNVIKKKLDPTHKNTKINIKGRIGRFVGCLPLQSDTFISTNQLTKDTKDEISILKTFYDDLWKRMEKKTFIIEQMSCDDLNYLEYKEFGDLTKPDIQPEEPIFQIKKPSSKHRRATDKQTPLGNALAKKFDKTILRTWADGYYLIELFQPEYTTVDSVELDIDVTVSMKNRFGGYITADEHPALIFYIVMCGIYAFFALLWFIWCALYWKELLKIQFWIGGVILIGMIEKSAFVVEYDTINRHGYKVHIAIVTAEVVSCFKRTLSRMLVIIVALGYGIVKPRLGPLKQKVFGMGILYFIIATTEALLRLNTKNDETNNKVLISRIPLAVIDATIYYWIFTGLVATTRTLRLRKNILKLNVYRHFTNTMIFAIIASLLFMIWSLKSHFFTTCITNWREFWVDDAFWHILFSLILLVIMFLFRPSNNNQRYAFVPLLDPSDNEDNDEFDEDEEKESAIFDSITMRKATNVENGNATKTKKQQQSFLNREANVSNNGANGTNNEGGVEEALTWVENNIPTSLADQALQALDSDEEIVNTKLERSKMQ